MPAAFLTGKDYDEMKSTLTYKIHYSGEYQDEIVISGESISEIRAKAYAQCEKRGWDTGQMLERRNMKHLLNICNINGAEVEPYPIAVTKSRFGGVTP